MSDNLEQICCPACGFDMTKIYVPEVKLFVDICTDNCGGIFFDKSEFEKFTFEKICIDAITNITDGEKYSIVDEKKSRFCPKCHTDMQKKYFDDDKNIEIDVCPICGSVFLDNKELEKIRALI